MLSSLLSGILYVGASVRISFGGRTISSFSKRSSQSGGRNGKGPDHPDFVREGNLNTGCSSVGLGVQSKKGEDFGVEVGSW